MRKVLFFVVLTVVVLMLVSCGGAGGTGGVLNVNQVLLVSPANGEIGIPVDYILDWTVDGSASRTVFNRNNRTVTEYRVYLAENTETGYPSDPFSTHETDYALSGLKAGTCYKWKVEAVLDNGEVKASAEKIFTTATGNEMRMIPVSAGTFQMGGETAVDVRAVSAHNVTLTKDFYVGTFEVTNAEFVAFLNDVGVWNDYNSAYIYVNDKRRYLMTTFEDNVYSGIGHTGSYNERTWFVRTEFNGIALNYANMPVVYVTWMGAVEYCNWLSRKAGLTEAYIWDESIGTYKLRDYPNNTGYRLPTEAEWEYAAHGGENVCWAGTSGYQEVNDYGWFMDNCDLNDGTGQHAQEVGKKKPNGFGLYDMSGNADELCSDNLYDYESNTAVVDPHYQNPVNATSTDRIQKGSCWIFLALQNKIDYRFGFPDGGYSFAYGRGVGFRVFRTLD